MFNEALSGLALGAGYVSVSWWVVMMGGAHDMARFSSLTALVMLIALPLTAPLGNRFPKNRVIACGLSLATVAALSLAVLAWHGVYLLLAMFVLEGILISVTSLIGQTHRTLAVPEAYRARVQAINILVAKMGGMLGPALAGLLLTHWSLDTVYLMFALAHLLLVIPMLRLPSVNTFLNLSHEDASNWYLKQHPEAFASVSSAPAMKQSQQTP